MGGGGGGRVDRKIHPGRHSVSLHEDYQVMLECDPKGRIFLPTPRTHDRFFFSNIAFISECGFLIMQSLIADICHIVMTSLCRLVTSLSSVTSTCKMAYVTSNTTSAYKTSENARF